MDSRVSYAIVGLFVIILTIVLIASLLWLGTGTDRKIFDTYQIYIKESVSGLNNKATVKYRGVEVGQVSRISLVPERPNEVLVLLEIERGIPLKKDTYATLASQGLTGLAYIELTGGSADAPPPTQEKGQFYPELQTKPSLLVRFDTAISALLIEMNSTSEMTKKLLVDLSSLSKTAHAFFSEDNRLALSRTLKNVDVITTTLAARDQELDNSLSQTSQILENSNHISQQLPGLITQLKNSLAAIEHGSDAFTEATTTMTKVIEGSQEDVIKTTRTLVQAATELNIAVKNSRKDLDVFTSQALPEMTKTLREMNEVLNNLRTFSQNLGREPNMLLFGKSAPKPGPGEE